MITNIVNFSHSSGQFHPILKKICLLKKSTLDKDEPNPQPFCHV